MSKKGSVNQQNIPHLNSKPTVKRQKKDNDSSVESFNISPTQATRMASQASRAVSILEGWNEAWTDFARDWVAFNAIYNYSSLPSERSRLKECIYDGVTEQQASNLLASLEPEMQYLRMLPPGDMRLSPHDPNFRRIAKNAIQRAMDSNVDPTERLASLIETVYQIRCNLIHGAKNPRNLRDNELVRKANSVLDRVLQTLLENTRGN